MADELDHDELMNWLKSLPDEQVQKAADAGMARARKGIEVLLDCETEGHRQMLLRVSDEEEMLARVFKPRTSSELMLAKQAWTYFMDVLPTLIKMVNAELYKRGRQQ